MEVLVFTLNAVVIYLLSDWIVRQLELRRSESLKHRQIYFFVIFLVLALVSFRLLRTLLGTGP